MASPVFHPEVLEGNLINCLNEIDRLRIAIGETNISDDKVNRNLIETHIDDASKIISSLAATPVDEITTAAVLLRASLLVYDLGLCDIESCEDSIFRTATSEINHKVSVFLSSPHDPLRTPVSSVR